MYVRSRCAKRSIRFRFLFCLNDKYHFHHILPQIDLHKILGMSTDDKKILEEVFFEVFGENHFELLEMLDRHGEKMVFEKGRHIFQEGDAATGFYWVLDGFVKVCKNLDAEHRQIITILSKGDFIGLSAVMNDHAFSKSSIVINKEANVIYMPKVHFMHWIEKFPSVVIPLMKQVESKIDRIENRAAFIMRKNIDQRLAYSIMMLKDKFGYDGNKFLKYHFTPQEFANFIGTTRTTIYRVFKKFEDQKLISVRGKRIQLMDAHRLEEIYKVG